VNPQKIPSWSPLRHAAREVTEQIGGQACSIYELRDTLLPASSTIFHLVGTFGCDETFLGPPAIIDLRARDHWIDEDGRRIWLGLTSFVALTGQAMNIASVLGDHERPYDGDTVWVRRREEFCELKDPGPFLAVPIFHTPLGVPEMLGVVRVLRGNGGASFSAQEERQLVDLGRLLAISVLQERDRHRTFRGFGDLAEAEDEDALLNAFVEQARELVHGAKHEAAVFLEEHGATANEQRSDEAPGGSEAEADAPLRATPPRRFGFRAPSSLTPTPAAYEEHGDGLTAHVVTHATPIILTNLDHDLKGRYRHIKHRRKKAETAEGSTVSWIGVPILEWPRRAETRAIGAVRISSPALAAFSDRDRETLEALAAQVSRLLHRLAEKHREHRVLNTFINTSTRPVIANDKPTTKQDPATGLVSLINGAAAELLGRSNGEIIGQPIVDVVYGGNEAMARETLRAIRDAPMQQLRDHYTLVFRKPTVGTRLIPIPVRFDATYLRDQKTGENTGTVGFLELAIRARPPSTVFEAGEGTALGITVDPALGEQLLQLQRLPQSFHKVPILILGETGSGKELLVDEIHGRSDPSLPIRKINCAELPEGLIQSELFGTVEGAFTGALNKPGIFDPKHFERGGTIFLDEVAELSLSAQAQLLRVIDKNVVRRVGGRRDDGLQVQIVAATSADLDACVAKETFRKDLLYRLRGMELRVPPLKHRLNDIMLLAMHFLDTRTSAEDVRFGFSSAAIRALLEHDWPGNVRELRNAVESAWHVARARGAEDLIRVDDLPPAFAKRYGPEPAVARAKRRTVESARPRASSIQSRDAQTLEIVRRALREDPSIERRLLAGARRSEFMPLLTEACRKAGAGFSDSGIHAALSKLIRLPARSSARRRGQRLRSSD